MVREAARDSVIRDEHNLDCYRNSDWIIDTSDQKVALVDGEIDRHRDSCRDTVVYLLMKLKQVVIFSLRKSV